jgi:hypothetical protein
VTTLDEVSFLGSNLWQGIKVADNKTIVVSDEKLGLEFAQVVAVTHDTHTCRGAR